MIRNFCKNRDHCGDGGREAGFPLDPSIRRKHYQEIHTLPLENY